MAVPTRAWLKAQGHAGADHWVSRQRYLCNIHCADSACSCGKWHKDEQLLLPPGQPSTSCRPTQDTRSSHKERGQAITFLPRPQARFGSHLPGALPGAEMAWPLQCCLVGRQAPFHVAFTALLWRGAGCLPNHLTKDSGAGKEAGRQWRVCSPLALGRGGGLRVDMESSIGTCPTPRIPGRRPWMLLAR